MTRVTGIGGVFIRAKDPAMLQTWYKKHLGIHVQAWGGTSFRWADESRDHIAVYDQLADYEEDGLLGFETCEARIDGSFDELPEGDTPVTIKQSVTGC